MESVKMKIDFEKILLWTAILMSVGLVGLSLVIFVMVWSNFL